MLRFRHRAVRKLAPTVRRAVGKRQEGKVALDPGHLARTAHHLHRRRHRFQVDGAAGRPGAPGVRPDVELRARLPDLDVLDPLGLSYVDAPVSREARVAVVTLQAVPGQLRAIPRNVRAVDLQPHVQVREGTREDVVLRFGRWAFGRSERARVQVLDENPAVLAPSVASQGSEQRRSRVNRRHLLPGVARGAAVESRIQRAIPARRGEVPIPLDDKQIRRQEVLNGVGRVAPAMDQMRRAGHRRAHEGAQLLLQRGGEALSITIKVPGSIN